VSKTVSVGCQLDRSPATRLSVGAHPHGLRLSALLPRSKSPLSLGLPTSAITASYYQPLTPYAPAAPRTFTASLLSFTRPQTRQIPSCPAISRH
jgi:hypothetical protein